jgi:hypothetical protein
VNNKKIEFFYPPTVSQKTIENLHGKRVDFVFHSSNINGLKEWSGELNTDEYFLIKYFHGKLAVTVAERETDFDKNFVYIGYTQESDSKIESKDGSSDNQYKIIKSNNINDLINKIKQEFVIKPSKVTFNDILEFLGWTMKENLEIMEFIN